MIYLAKCRSRFQRDCLVVTHAAQCVTYIIPFFVHLVEEDSMIYLAKCRSCFQRDCLVVTHAAQCVTTLFRFSSNWWRRIL